MIRDRGSDFTASFDAVLADAGIGTVRCNVRTPRMNAIAERWIGDTTVNSWTVPSSRNRSICGGIGAEPPLEQPLPQPVDLGQYRVRKRACVGGLINEYRLVA